MTDLLPGFIRAMATGLAQRSAQPGADVWPAPIVNLQEANFVSHTPLLAALGTSTRTILAGPGGPQRIADAFRFPARPAHLMYLFNERPASEAEGADRRMLAEVLLQAISLLRGGDPFCATGVNRVWTPGRAAEELETFPDDRRATEQEARLASRLIVMLSSYCEALYFALLAFGREFHGPYGVAGGQVIVRDFYDLHPSHWRFQSNLPFRHVRIDVVYDEAVDISFDFAGRMQTAESLAARASAIRLFINEQQVEADEGTLQTVAADVEAAMKLARDEVRALSPRELLVRWSQGQFWATREVHEAAGRPELAVPPAEMIRALSEDPLVAWLPLKMAEARELTETERVDMLMGLLDPGNPDKGRD